MKTKNKWTIAAVSALVVMLGASSSSAVLFGSANDGLGGFTQSTATTSTVTWATNTDSVRYANADVGTYNGSFLRAYTLDRSVGQSYIISGTLKWVEGDPDTNNRLGMYFFGDTASVLSVDGGLEENETGALSLIFNTDDGDVPPSDSNADDDLGWLIGIDQTLIIEQDRTQTLVPSAGDLRGTVISFQTALDFVDIGGINYINLAATMTAGGEDTVVSTQVLADDYTGDYFGFVTRARNNTPLDLAWTVEYQSFDITAIPEPATFGLVAVMGGAFLIIRRRFMI